MARQWIHQTRTTLILKDVIQAGLVAGDTGIDFIGACFLRFEHPIGVREKRTSHRDHVGRTFRQYLLGYVWHVDTIGRHQRNPHLAH